jgi:hypothetical protein
MVSMVSSIGVARGQSTSSQGSFLNGSWLGVYSCAGGLTKLKLDIEAKSSSDISAVFSSNPFGKNFSSCSRPI